MAGEKMTEVQLEITEIVTELGKGNEKVMVKLKGQRDLPEKTYVSVTNFPDDFVKQVGEGRKTGAKFYLKCNLSEEKLIIVTDHG